MAQRVAVFIDYQNVYKGARSSFCPWDGPHMDGQVSPLRTGIRPHRRIGSAARQRSRVSRHAVEKHDPKGSERVSARF